MKIPLRWLKQHLEGEDDVEKITATLCRIGFDVESILYEQELYRHFLIGKILEVSPHPAADRLKICKVHLGGENIVSVVCGAGNVVEGLTSVYAPVGACLPGNKMPIREARIRGVRCFGMLCSEQELSLSLEGEGIMELEGASSGAAFADFIESDVIIDIEVTPNRPYGLNIHGIARELAAAGLGTLIPLKPLDVPSFSAPTIGVTADFPSQKPPPCDFFCLQGIKGVTNSPSPQWLKNRLRTIGLSSISSVVDCMNFTMMDTGQPLHAFDANKIKGNLRLKIASGGEQFLGLDEERYTCPEGACLICDDTGVISLAGVLGGATTKCDLDTKDLLIEAAYFLPESIARTGRSLSIITESRTRFERATDPAFVTTALKRAVHMVRTLCGGKPTEVVSLGQIPSLSPIAYDPNTAARLLGTKIANKTQQTILKALGFQIKEQKPIWQVTPPSFRPHCHLKEDIVEDIARIQGYEHLLAVPLPHKEPSCAFLTPKQGASRHIRRCLAVRGLHEVVSYSFISKALDETYQGWLMPQNEPVVVENPISEDLSVMRRSLIPSLVKVAMYNRDRQQERFGIFEVGGGYFGMEAEEQVLFCSGLRGGLFKERIWNETARHGDVFDIKADVETVLEAFGCQNIRFRRSSLPSWLHPGAGAFLIEGDNNVVGVFGLFHPRLQELVGPSGGCFELCLDRLPVQSSPPSPPKISSFPASKRDFAFLLPKHIPVEKVVKTTETLSPFVVQVSVFDVYENEMLKSSGQYSLALSVKYQSSARTLTGDDIEGFSKQLCQRIKKLYGGVLRKEEEKKECV